MGIVIVEATNRFAEGTRERLRKCKSIFCLLCPGVGVDVKNHRLTNRMARIHLFPSLAQGLQRNVRRRVVADGYLKRGQVREISLSIRIVIDGYEPGR